METQIQTHPDVILGEYTELQRLAKRIKLMVKDGNRLSDEEALALAQIAHVTQLNPFIGEVWYIPGKGPMIGIAGARRVDNERTDARGGYSWPLFTPVSPEEAGATPQDLTDGIAGAFKVEINDSAATAQYQALFVESLKAMRESKVDDPFSQAKEICGERPVWVGYGYSTIKEPSRMNKLALAKKRAEADALKKRIVLPFGAEVSIHDSRPVADVDVEGVDIEYPEQEEKPRTEAQNVKQLGFNPDPVQDQLWNDWRSLCARAKKVKVPVADVKRESMTQPELQQSYDELMRFVLDAEDQGAVGA